MKNSKNIKFKVFDECEEITTKLTLNELKDLVKSTIDISEDNLEVNKMTLNEMIKYLYNFNYVVSKI